MSDQQPEQSFEEALINRLAQRLGVASAQIEALQMQLEQAQHRVQQLEAMTEPHPPMSNGFSDAYEGVASV